MSHLCPRIRPLSEKLLFCYFVSARNQLFLKEHLNTRRKMFYSLCSVLGTRHPKTTPTESLVLYDMYKIVCPGIQYRFFSWFFLLLLSMFVYFFIGGKEPARFYGSTRPSLILYTAVFLLYSGKTVANYYERTDDISNILLNCRIISNTVQCMQHCWTSGSI